MRKVAFCLSCIFLLSILAQAENAQAAELSLAELQKAAERGDSVAQYNLEDVRHTYCYTSFLQRIQAKAR